MGFRMSLSILMFCNDIHVKYIHGFEYKYM